MRTLAALSLIVASTSCLTPFVSTAASAAEPSSADGNPGYYTYHYDNERTGWNPKETKLSTATVASGRFRLVRTLATDSVVYAQPLYAPQVRTRFGTRNVVYIASEGDSVYAYDSDSGQALWRRNFTDPAAGITAVVRTSVADCPSISPTIGISSTPVIDPARHTLYVVDKIQITRNGNTSYHNQLHALDLSDGSDRVSPAEIGGSIKLADGSSTTFFDQRQQNRPGLALANGAVYVAFGSSCDAVPGAVHGWVFGYEASTLRHVATLDTTASAPDTYLGSIWQSTVAPAVNAKGELFFATGNGTFDPSAGRGSYDDSILRTSSELAVRDYFAPKNNLALSITDQDVGSTGVMLVPYGKDTRVHLAVSGAKNGVMYLLNQDNLGHYDPAANRILQEITLENAPNSLYGGPAYYRGFLYWGAGAQPMQAFALKVSPTPKLVPASQTKNSFPGEGGEIPAVSSDGTKPGTAVVWATTRPPQGGTIELYAYDARDLGRTLFSGAAGQWLAAGDAFLTPTVAAGHVFVPGAGLGVAEFGLR